MASTSTTRIYSSSKGNEAVNVAKVSSIPVKMRDQTIWTVHIWSDWASDRNNVHFQPVTATYVSNL